MRLALSIIILCAALTARAQTAVECLRDYYLSGITSPASLNNTRFTGIKLTVTGATSSTYLSYPVTATVSGNFVKMRGNNAISANVDYTSATPTFASANALLIFTQGCAPLIGGGGSGDNWGTQTVQHDNSLTGQGILGNELKVDSALFVTRTYLSVNTAVIQASGRPTYNPTGTLARIWHDVTNERVYEYKTSPSAGWYTQGTITSSSAPVIVETLSGITVNNTQADWYNTTNDLYYKVVGGTSGSWQSIAVFDISNIVYRTGNQTIAGEKTMTDTLRANKGVVAGTSSFTGTASKAAVSSVGVQQEKYTIINSTTTLDGTYYEVGVNTTSGDVTVILPTASSSNKGWKYIIHKTSESLPNKIIISRPFSTSHIMYGGNKTCKSDGTDWLIYNF